MKTIEEINHARDVLCGRCRTPGLSDQQVAMLSGMLNALVWAADGSDCETMNRLIGGEPLVPGRTIPAEEWQRT